MRIAGARVCASAHFRQASDDISHSRVTDHDPGFCLPGTGTDRAGGTTDDDAGTETFFVCFGFFASRLLR